MPFIPDEQQQPTQVSSVQQPKKEDKNILGSAWDAMKGIAGRAFYGPSQMLGGGIEALKQVGEGTYKAPDLGSFSIPNIQGGKNTIQTGELINPAFVGFARGWKDKKSVQEELPKAVNVDPESGKGILIGLGGELMTPDILDVLSATKVGKKAIETVGKKAGKVLEKGGEYIAEMGVKPTLSQARKFKNATKKTIGQFITDQKLAGNVAENIANRVFKLQNAFDDIAVSSGIKVNSTQFGQAMQKTISRLNKYIEKKEIKALQEFAQDLGSGIKEGGLLGKFGMGEIDVADLTDMRKLLDDRIPESQWQKLLGGDKVSADVLKRMFLQDLIQDATSELKSASGQTLKKLGQELSHLYSLSEIVAKQAPVTVAGRLGGLGDITAIGAGALKGGLPGAIAGFAGRRIATNPRVLGETSNILYKTGEALVEQSPLLKKFAGPALKTGKEAVLGILRPDEEPETYKGPTPGFIPD